MSKKPKVLIVVLLAICACFLSSSAAQTSQLPALTRSDVLLDSTKPPLSTCFEKSSDKKHLLIRVTNNYRWILQLPLESGGQTGGVITLPGGRGVALLADGVEVNPHYFVEAPGTEAKQGYRGHGGTLGFFAPGRSFLFSVPKPKSGESGNGVYVDFNYEWELPTISLAIPHHRIQVSTDSYSIESRGCGAAR
jgi:hypothetical protein